jgi:hypothetical protein
MAEIEIKRKEKKSAWPWIIGLLLLVALVVWFLLKDGGKDNTGYQEDYRVKKEKLNVKKTNAEDFDYNSSFQYLPLIA